MHSAPNSLPPPPPPGFQQYDRQLGLLSAQEVDQYVKGNTNHGPYEEYSEHLNGRALVDPLDPDSVRSQSVLDPKSRDGAVVGTAKNTARRAMETTKLVVKESPPVVLGKIALGPVVKGYKKFRRSHP